MSFEFLVRWLAAGSLAACSLAGAEVIDRIAVSVGNRVITTSDIDREIRVIAFQQQISPDFGALNRRATADRLVEQKLINRELETSRYPIPTSAEVEPEIVLFRKTFPNDDAFNRALAQYGITLDDFRTELVRERALVMFTDVRFRPGIQVTEQEIEDYFKKNIEAPARSGQGGKVPAFEDSHDKAEEALIEERLIQQVDDWLKQVRRRVDVVYHEEVFQ
jgi:peptidyl-prolyl cis-trans isomerase SurA